MLLFAFEIGKPAEIVGNYVMILTLGTRDNHDAFLVRLFRERARDTIRAHVTRERNRHSWLHTHVAVARTRTRLVGALDRIQRSRRAREPIRLAKPGPYTGGKRLGFEN